MKRIILLSLIMAGMMFSAQAFAKETLWVSSDNATLKTDKSTSSETVTTLPAGTELSVISYEKKWYKVKTKEGKKGWIYRGKVTDEPPDSEEFGEEDELFDDVLVSSIESYSAGTSRSIRGRRVKGAKKVKLTPQAKQYAKDTRIPGNVRKALQKVLTVKIEDAEMETFLKGGKIGEFAQ